jgi:hypothetical protein
MKDIHKHLRSVHIKAAQLLKVELTEKLNLFIIIVKWHAQENLPIISCYEQLLKLKV